MSNDKHDHDEADHDPFDLVEALCALGIFVVSTLLGLVGIIFFKWELVVVMLLGCVFTAFNPQIGRWRHVWE